jgi:putative redox protein
MKIVLNRLDDAYHLEMRNEEGNLILTDASPAIGGANKGMRPMQLVLCALASCSAIDVIQFLKKMRQPLEDIEIVVDGQREKDQVPALFTDIQLHFKLRGRLDSGKVERAISLSIDKYCSVARILEKTARITWNYQIITSDG